MDGVRLERKGSGAERRVYTGNFGGYKNKVTTGSLNPWETIKDNRKKKGKERKKRGRSRLGGCRQRDNVDHMTQSTVSYLDYASLTVDNSERCHTNLARDPRVISTHCQMYLDVCLSYFPLPDLATKFLGSFARVDKPCKVARASE